MEETAALNQTCPYCGAPLPDNAAFCPHCARSINQRTELTPPSPPAWRKALRVGIPLLAIAAVILGLWLHSLPRTYEGGAEIFYEDEDGQYQIVLGWMNSRYSPADEVYQPVAIRDMLYTFPQCLYVNQVGTGLNKGSEFMEKVASYHAEFVGQDGEETPWYTSSTQPRPDYVPEAALVTSINFTAYSSPEAELVWTIEMKNGDVIRGRQTMYCQPYNLYEYYPEDVPMNTIEELQALVDEIDKTIDDEHAEINLYLPPVTYDGGLVMEGNAIHLYGSDNGRTTFTDTIRICPEGTPVLYVENIDFVGNSNSIGVSTNARVFLLDCTIAGWKTGILPYGDHTWVTARNCVLEGNKTGFHFIGTGNHVTSNNFTGNRFLNNGTALLLESIPGNDFELNLSGCVFSGNEVDIDNRCNQALNISEAVFQ